MKEPKPISNQEMSALLTSIDMLRSIRKRDRVQEAQMDARMSDFLELAEQDYLKGWTDCEIGKAHADGSDAYNAGYGDCYEWENRSDGYGEDLG
jgi:hypothetical protein